MHDSRMQKLARNLIRYSCGLKRGEKILIEAIDIPEPMASPTRSGGDGGGCLVTAGTPEAVAKTKKSYTGQFLAQVLQNHKEGTRRAS